MDETEPGRERNTPKLPARFTGCLLGGAVGDALGAPAADLTLAEILGCYGSTGIAEYEAAFGRRGAVTDNTRMTLFTSEGLILSRVRQEYAPGKQAVAAVYHACLRWLYTQDYGRQTQLIHVHGTCAVVDGILTGYREMFARRTPDPACLSALRSGVMGTMEQPINYNKGCGGLVRAAPMGLFFPDVGQAFEMGCACAAITHGHPGGYLPAGVLAALLSGVLSGRPLPDAVVAAEGILKMYDGHEACLQAVEGALALVHRRQPSPETMATLGSGRTAAEVLAIALYCALSAGDDFRRGVRCAVNHSGKSDATGAIAGHILGACCGDEAIPDAWIAGLELGDIIAEVAADLFDQVTDGNVQR